MKVVALAIGIFILCSCSAGNSKVAVTSTTDLPPGTYSSSNLAVAYSTTSLASYLLSQICLPGTTATDCQANQDNLFANYSFQIDQVESVTDKINAYTMEYSTQGMINENRLVSGSILVPDIAPNLIKGVVLYYHSTSVTKSQVPSCLGGTGVTLPSYCNFTSLDGENLGSIIASQGYIVVMPDYVGQGVDNQVMHPYIFYPQNNALAGIYMLNATRTLLTELGYTTDNKFSLYLLGFSEGASYALWATKLLQTNYSNILINNNYQLALSVPLSGAYDLVNAQMPMELNNVTTNSSNYNILNTLTATISKPTLIGFALSAYGFYSLDQNYSSLMSPSFFNCPTCLISGTAYTIATLFNTSSLDWPSIEGYITTSAGLTGYGINGDNSAKALIVSGLEDEPEFKQALSEASLTSFNSVTPINFVYLSKDSVVTNLNSSNAYNGMKGISGSGVIRATVLDNSPSSALYKYHDSINNVEAPIDHTQSAPFVLIAALAGFL